MSTKWAYALLVIVALSLLLMSGSALSRPEMAPRDEGAGLGWVTQDDDDGPDIGDPGDGAVGDDDNWDKPGVDVHGPSNAELRVDDVWTGGTEDSKPEDLARSAALVWLRFLLRAWW
ncbi:MAG: hypothetical protein ABIG03_02050 [Candidatus Eisenbacteria bacterium]